MGFTMRLRDGTTEDAPALGRLFLDSRRRAMPYLHNPHSDTEVMKWIEGVVLLETRVIVAALEDGEILGFASIRSESLDHLYVAPSAQGKGTGSRLLAAAKEASPAKLRLKVFQRNAAARTFYERRGFLATELRDGSQNEEREPDAVYEWRPQTR